VGNLLRCTRMTVWNDSTVASLCAPAADVLRPNEVLRVNVRERVEVLADSDNVKYAIMTHDKRAGEDLG
jgi:hypothetical protein